MNDLILIKPNQCCISLGDSHKERISAENHSSLFHYCKLSDLEKILESETIKLNNLANIDKNSDYERDNVDPDFWGLVFIACLTANGNSDTLWSNFGDNHHGVCIQFIFNNSFFEEIVNKDKTAVGYSNAGEKICEFGYNLSSVKAPKPTCIPNINTESILDIKLTDVYYTNNPDSSSVYTENEKMANISNIAKYVPTWFLPELETRVIGVLRATHEVILSQIDYILLPINLSNIKLHFGRKVKTEEKEFYTEMLSQRRTK